MQPWPAVLSVLHPGRRHRTALFVLIDATDREPLHLAHAGDGKARPLEPWLSGLSGLSGTIWALSGYCLGTVWLDS